MAKKSSILRASSKAVDPTLDALFASSAGPVQPPPKSRYSVPVGKKPREEPESETSDMLSDGEDAEYKMDSDNESAEMAEDDDDDGKQEDDGLDKSRESSEEQSKQKVDAAAKDVTQSKETKRERKRKRNEENDDLEDRYLSKLAEDDGEPPKRQKGDQVQKDEESEDGEKEDEESVDDEPPKHLSLTQEGQKSDIDKANRTVFLANVSTEAINSKSAKKTLLKHLGSVLKEGEKVESMRFRSVAFSTGAMPKRAAYIKRQLMSSTTKSANAYAVYSTSLAARRAVAELNGTEVLGRHIRIDSVAHPTPTDHRRCVFVGNLGFVDDETVLKTGEDGETVERKRNKIPSDIEEGLWRTFGKQGKVENVRVIRDANTRVGKGFAYVHFADANTVESALLLDGKKFPPMLPRPLRVTRAKDPRKTALHQERIKAKLSSSSTAKTPAKPGKHRRKFTAEEQTSAGRVAKLLGRSAAHAERGGALPALGVKTPEQIVFEGKRASAKDGRPKDLKFGRKKVAVAAAAKSKLGKRGTKRTAEWKKKEKGLGN